MQIVNNYIDSFIFHLNDMNAVFYKAIGMPFHYTTGWDFLLACIETFVMMYFYGKSNIPELIDRYDSNMRYTTLFINFFGVVMIYIYYGVEGILLLLCMGIVLVSFYLIVLRNKKYAWLKEFLMKLY